MACVCLVVLVGLPAAGKTTFCQRLMSTVHFDKFCIKVIHFDDFLSNAAYCSSRKEIFKTVKQEIDNIIHSLHLTPCIIILDDNMIYKSMRKQYYKLAMEYEISYLSVYFKIDTSLALLRNTKRMNNIPTCVLQKSADTIEIPTDAFVVNADKELCITVFDAFINYVKVSLQNPLKAPQKITCSNLTVPSKIQEIDLILRKIVSEKIKEKQTWETLKTVKNKILTNIGKGKIIIDFNCNSTTLEKNLEEHFSCYLVM